MKFRNHFKKVTLLVLAIAVMSVAVNYPPASKASSVDYSYKIHNGARCYIDSLQVSENGRNWGNFDIGKGVAPGETVTLVWDKSTDNSNCEWWIKAKFADGLMSKAAKFDFCEEGLILDF